MREASAARTPSLFRGINERIRTSEAGLNVHGPAVSSEWICECANQSCFERVTMSHDAYEAIREHGARFFVTPGRDHFEPNMERLVERNEHYWIVEKVGQSEWIANRFAPRSRAVPLRT